MCGPEADFFKGHLATKPPNLHGSRREICPKPPYNNLEMIKFNYV